jgi:hypothetical protein
MFLPRDILPRLPEPWRTRYANEQSGGAARVVRDYPRWRNGGFRLDAAVPGGAPGSDIGVLRAQLLDEYGTDIAILIPLTFGLEGPAAYRAALCRAINDWVPEEWLDRDTRLRASLNVPFDSPHLVGSGVRVKGGHDDAAPQPLVAIKGLLPHPRVDRCRHRGLEVRVTTALECRDTGQDHRERLVGIEELGTLFLVGMRREAASCAGLGTRRHRLALRIGAVADARCPPRMNSCQ